MSSESTQVSSFYSLDNTTRLNGTEFASGLDTQRLIKALTSKTTAKINSQKQLEQKAEWKRDMFREIEAMLQNFSDDYFSYSSKSETNIMSKSFFDSEILTSSDSDTVTATGAMGDAGNVIINSISQLATRASLSTMDKVSDEKIESLSAIGTTISSSSYLTLKVGKSSYNVTIGSDINTFSNGTARNATDIATEISADLQKQIDNNLALKSVTVSATNGKLSLTGATITGASQNFIDGLKLTKGGTDDNPIYTFSSNGDIDSNALSSLKTQLAGVTLNFQLDGLQKNIVFDQSDSDNYSTPARLQSYLQGKLDSAFGSNKISVALDSSNKLSFMTETTDTTSVFKINGASDGGTLGKDGIFHIESGETNRLELTKTLGELSTEPELANALSSSATKVVTDKDGNPVKDEDGNPVTVHVYEISVNGKTFSFDDNTELDTVINTINNDSDADVNISYSQTLDKFRVVSNDTGSQETISVKDISGKGNLAFTLFGDNNTCTSGKDLMMNVTLGGTSRDITRSTNSFTLDGLELNIKKETVSGGNKISFTASSNADDVYKNISAFIDEYNKLMDKINTDVSQGPYGLSNETGKTQSYDPLTDDQKKGMSDTEITEWNEKAKQGLLFCDPQLMSLQNDLRGAMENTVESAGISLNDIGISVSSDYMSGGKLEITDENKLKNALTNDSDKVIQLFTCTDNTDDSKDGISGRIRKVIVNYVGAYGNSGILFNVAGSSTMVGADQSELSTQISEYNNQIKDLQSQLTTEQDNFQAKFTRMEQVISQLSSQYNYLSSMTS